VEIGLAACAAAGQTARHLCALNLCAAAQVLRPAKLWCDVEAAAEAAQLSAAHGRTIVPSFTGAKWVILGRAYDWAAGYLLLS